MVKQRGVASNNKIVGRAPVLLLVRDMLIQVENFTKKYGNRVAVQNITFWVNQGEIFGVLGPKGSGKTTIMRVLAGYTPPSDGNVTVAGYDVLTHSAEVCKQIGYLPATVSLYTDMRLRHYLDFVAKLRQISARDERISEIMEQFNLTPHAQTFIGKLPKGVRRRVGLAQAVLHRPKILILDEPTAGLDPVEIVKIHQLIKLLGQSHTILLSTRALSEAERICHRVLLLDRGRNVAQETPDRLVTRLDGGQTIRLQVAAAPSNAAEMLQALDGINRVSAVGFGKFDIECNCGVECRPAVAKLVVEQGWGLLELQVVDASLEDISVELTTDPQVAV